MQQEVEPKIIIDYLRQELQLQRRHYKILQEQNSALIACDRPRFVNAQMLYSAFLVEAKAHADERSLLFGAGPGSLKQQMMKWPGHERSGGIAVIEAIRNVLDRIQFIGRQNAVMIDNELKYGKFMFDLYVEAMRKQANYAGRGMRPVRTETLLINQVA